MEFSIIVVCLNAGEKLLETINSILRQSLEDYEIVVKDGMSTDGSLERLPSDSRIRIVRQKDGSIYEAMNQAIGLSQGEYLLFLNCGDLFYDSRVLERVSGCIGRDGRNSEIYYGNIYNRLTGSFVASNPRIDAFACYRNIPCHQACFYKRELMLRRSYRPEYRVRADYEHFLWSYFEGGVRPVYADVTVASYEGGGYSETQENRLRSDREHKEITERYMAKGQIFRYRLLLFLTFASLRSRLAGDSRFSGCYNRLKQCIYRKRGS